MLSKKVTLLLIVIIYFIGSAEPVDDERGLLLKTPEYSDILKNGAKHIRNAVTDLIKKKEIDTYLRRGFKIANDEIEKCVASEFKYKYVRIYDLKFQTQRDLNLTKVTFNQNIFNKARKRFSYDLEINFPLSLVTGKFYSDITYKDSNSELGISFDNLNIELQIQGQEVPEKNKNLKSATFDCITRFQISEGRISSPIDESKMGQKKSRYSVIYKPSRDSVVMMQEPSETYKKLMSTTKVCVRDHILSLMSEELEKWCLHYIDKDVLNGAYEHLNERLIYHLDWRTQRRVMK